MEVARAMKKTNKQANIVIKLLLGVLTETYFLQKPHVENAMSGQENI